MFEIDKYNAIKNIDYDSIYVENNLELVITFNRDGYYTDCDEQKEYHGQGNITLPVLKDFKINTDTNTNTNMEIEPDHPLLEKYYNLQEIRDYYCDIATYTITKVEIKDLKNCK